MTAQYMNYEPPLRARRVPKIEAPDTFEAEALEMLVFFECQLSSTTGHVEYIEYLENQTLKCRRQLRAIKSCPGCQGTANQCPKHGYPGDFWKMMIHEDESVFSGYDSCFDKQWEMYIEKIYE